MILTNLDSIYLDKLESSMEKFQNIFHRISRIYSYSTLSILSALVSTVLVCVAAECAGCPGLGGVVAQHGWRAVLLRGV